MTYIAFLRGINVGGKGIIKMAALKQCFESVGLTGVSTYFQSGNVIFESDGAASALTDRLERALATRLGHETMIVLRSRAQLGAVLDAAPRGWATGTHLRRYLAFLRASTTAKQAVREVEIREGIDSVTAGKGVLYMSTPLKGLSKSRLTKIVSKPIYQDMTIRNYSTCLKILEQMERK
jgi:uncharacterized protein (DUF1697 family)